MRKLLIAIGMLALASCQTQQSLYSWYNSEDAYYEYTKRLTEDKFAKAMSEYNKVISKQKGIRKVVPPGAYAEYGFLLYKTGKKDEGITMLKEEIKTYPESEKFISRIINQLEK